MFCASLPCFYRGSSIRSTAAQRAASAIWRGAGRLRCSRGRRDAPKQGQAYADARRMWVGEMSDLCARSKRIAIRATRSEYRGWAMGRLAAPGGFEENLSGFPGNRYKSRASCGAWRFFGEGGPIAALPRGGIRLKRAAEYARWPKLMTQSNKGRLLVKKKITAGGTRLL